jgi:cytochrome c2
MLIDRMWNHQSQMHNAMAARGIAWPQLSSQELDDMLVYLQNLPQTRGTQHFIDIPSPENGQELFTSKGCAECHKGSLALENRLGDSTLTDIAADMWNHAPRMRQPPPEISISEWRTLLSYVWAKQFFSTRGDADRGKKVFESKKCAVCHNDASSGAPKLTKPPEPYSAISMVSVLWQHGPTMLKRMQERRIAWPQLSQTEMANLIAYLNSR